MKPLITISFLLALLLAFSTVFSQKKEIKVVQTERIEGKNLITGSEIKVAEFLFPERVHDTFLDTATNLLTVQLRNIALDGISFKNKGSMVQYDTKKDKILWTKKINYPKSNILQSENTIIHTIDDISYNIDVYTGNNIWEVRKELFFLDPTYKIAMGYIPKNNYELNGINLVNGNQIWKRRIDKEYGWNDLSYLNDSTLLVAASGLHTVNMNTGKGWDYNTITGEKVSFANSGDVYAGFMMGYLFGFVGGLVGGLIYGLAADAYAIKTGENIIRDIMSNILINNNFIYFASKEQLVKIEKESGNIIWKYPLSENIVSNSSIFMDESTIYMVNRGYAFKAGAQICYGKSYIAAFDKFTGKQRYLIFVDDKSRFIRSFKVFGDQIYLVFANRISIFDLKAGKIISENFFKMRLTSELKYFADDHIFVNAGSNSLIPLWESDSTKLYVFNGNDHLLTINNEFNVTGTIAKKDIWTYFLDTESYSLFFNNFSEGRKTIVTNKLGQKLAELDVSPSAFIINNILYDKRDKSFIAIDLKQIP